MAIIEIILRANEELDELYEAALLGKFLPKCIGSDITIRPSRRRFTAWINSGVIRNGEQKWHQ
ncbi:hypothetical protein VDG05_12945 [Xanthomonas campestris pv. raphani]|uniref:hypothetical protein n=1 Tax=Xanthomonas campestris TaxID=339 RepID=UPI002B228A87|nr:hypothetical protein [Xanthomonas campestris]MEA9885239.1 hypothetical protein [Xanthomonas campestris pv. raphani]MEB2183090.1 hypothetical protein [Xanthomonas campestris pv. campestris]